MCGVAGIVRRDGGPVPPDALMAMTAVMAHRGPDDWGHVLLGLPGRTALPFIDEPPAPGPNVGLGHRRLSILDLSPQGHQPMCNADGTVWLSYNGEIYNYLELRRELEQRYPFRSQTDTEVILHLYEQRGPEAVEALEGMFAFILVDQRDGTVLLARDRFGIKPLYLYEAQGLLVVASEIKGLFASGLVPRALDPIGLLEHFTFQWCLGQRTCYRGIQLLPHGSWRILAQDRDHQTGYWSFDFRASGPAVEAEELTERFTRSVRRQLRSDVPVGTFLSGGMDTGAISCVAASQLETLHTFTCGFRAEDVSEMERAFDERENSLFLAKRLGSIHHVLTLDRDSLGDLLDPVAWYLEEPRVGISYQNFAMAAVVRRHVTVVLSGVGGDELFAGYPWRYLPFLDEDRDFEERYYQAWVRLLDDDEKRELFSPDFLGEALGYSTQDAFVAEAARTRGLPSLHRALKFDADHFLQGLLLVEDRLSMAHSVESRVPFLDEEVIGLAMRMRPEQRLLRDRSGFRTKVLLKEAMRALLPSRVLESPKVGFTPPAATWFAADQNSLRELLLRSNGPLRGYVRPHRLDALLEQHRKGLRNHRQLIWSLLVLDRVLSRSWAPENAPRPSETLQSLLQPETHSFA